MTAELKLTVGEEVTADCEGGGSGGGGGGRGSAVMLGEGEINTEDSDITTKVVDGVGVWNGKEVGTEEEKLSSREVDEGERDSCDTEATAEGEGVSDGCVVSCEDEGEGSTSLEVTNEVIIIEVNEVADGRTTEVVLGRTTGTAGRQP